MNDNQFCHLFVKYQPRAKGTKERFEKRYLIRVHREIDISGIFTRKCDVKNRGGDTQKILKHISSYITTVLSLKQFYCINFSCKKVVYYIHCMDLKFVKGITFSSKNFVINNVSN